MANNKIKNNKNNKKKYLLPASKLPVERGPMPKDFRESVQWRIFRIMSEFVDGFNFLADIKKSVTFFGSARTKDGENYYQEALDLASWLAKDGYEVVTGGGPGIMEAANRGATQAKGISIGLNIQLPHEQRINDYVNRSIAFHYFFTRKLMLSYSAQAYVYFPGGYGTLDEFFEIITLIQTKKIDKILIVAIGRNYWTKLLEFLKSEVYGKHEAIDKEDLALFKIVDSAEEAYKLIKKAKFRKIDI